MSTFKTPPDDLTDREDFQNVLSHLIETAEAENIDISGGYRYDAVDGGQDYGIEIYRVAG